MNAEQAKAVTDALADLSVIPGLLNCLAIAEQSGNIQISGSLIGWIAEKMEDSLDVLEEHVPSRPSLPAAT